MPPESAGQFRLGDTWASRAFHSAPAWAQVYQNCLGIHLFSKLAIKPELCWKQVRVHCLHMRLKEKCARQ